jgi:glycosyltransferase involved in cell wall biosynthesis
VHVLFMHNTFPSGNEEGSGRQYDFAKQLVVDGHEVTIIASQYSYVTGEVKGKTGLIVEEHHPAGFRILRTWSARGYHASYARRVWGFATYMATSFVAAMRVRRPDVLVAASPPITVAMIGGLVARLRGLPFVFEIRDLWSQVAAELGIVKNRLILGVVRAWERSLQRQARIVVINSPGFIPHLLAAGVDSDRVSVVPNGVDLSLFRPADDRESIRRALGFDGRYVVVYAGSLGLANDLPTIVAAADRLRDHPDVLFVLVGDGNRRRVAEEDVAARGLTNVRFVGAIAKQEVPRYLSAADATLCTLLDTPLFRTVYPNKVFDGMACGRPVLCAVDGVIRKVVDESAAGVFVAPSNLQALVDAVLALRADPAAADAMGRRGRAHVEKHFDRWECARLMSHVLSESVAR